MYGLFRLLNDNNWVIIVRERIKGSWFVNHESISGSHEPKIRKTSIFRKLFFQNIILK